MDWKERLRVFAQGVRDAVKPERGPQVRGSPPVGEVGVVHGWTHEFLSLFGSDTNPDETVQHFGLDKFEAFERKDAHVRNCYRIRRSMLIRLPWEVTPATDSRKDKRVAEFVTWVLKNMKGTFVQDVKELMDALSKGYSVSELIWGRLAEGPWKGHWATTELRSKPPQNFLFRRDKYGRLEKDGFRIRVPGELQETPVDIDKFVVWTFDKQYEDPHGRGLGSTVSWCAWFKKSGLKFWLIFLEKFGSPTLKIQLPNPVTAPDKERAKAIIKTIQTDTGFWYPEGFEAELLEAAKKGEGGYKDLLEWCDRQISKAILGQTLTTDTGEKGGGSYALGKEHTKVLDKLVRGDAEDLEACLNEQLVKRLVDYNFPVDEYPSFHWVFPKETIDLDAKGLKELVDMGLPVAYEEAYDKFGLRRPTKEEQEQGEVLRAAPKQGPPGGGFRQGEGDDNGGGDTRGASHPLDRAPSRINTVLLSESGQSTKGPIDVNAFTQTVGRDLDDLVAVAVAEANPTVLQATSDYIDAIGTSGVFESRDLRAVADLRPDYKGLEDVLHRTLHWAGLEGITDAQRLLKAKGWKPEELEFGERATEDLIVFLWEAQVSPIDVFRFVGLEGDTVPGPDEAISFFRKLQIVPSEVFYASDLGGRAFTISWTASDAARATVQDKLIEALDNGWAFEEFRDNLLADPTFTRDYLPLGPRNAHLETVFRTNVMTAYNQGRRQMFLDGHVRPFIRYWQLNAVLDGRTRPSHAAQHGVTLPPNDPYWDEWYPPNGFNCRCTVDPVTKADRFIRRRGAPKGPIIIDGKQIALTPDKGFGLKAAATTTGVTTKIATTPVPVLTPAKKAAATRAARKIVEGLAKKPAPKTTAPLPLDKALAAVDKIDDVTTYKKDILALKKILARQLGCQTRDIKLEGFARNIGYNRWDVREIKRIVRDYATWADEYSDVSLRGGVGQLRGSFGDCGIGRYHGEYRHSKWAEAPGIHSRIRLNPDIMTDQYRASLCTPSYMGKSTNVAAGTEIHEWTHSIQANRWYDTKTVLRKRYTTGPGGPTVTTVPVEEIAWSDEGMKIYGWTGKFRQEILKRPNVAKYFSDYGKELAIEVHTEVHAALRYPQAWIRRFGYVDFIAEKTHSELAAWVYEHADYVKRLIPSFPKSLFESKMSSAWERAFLHWYGTQAGADNLLADCYGTWLWETKWSRVYYGLMRRCHLISGNETFVPQGMSRFTPGGYKPPSYKGN